jgi:RNA polymerase sigma-70 factor (ECF subfamily)
MINRENFEKVFKKHYHNLWLYARHFVVNEDVAEDIVQEIFYNLLKSKKDLDGHDSLKAYLFTATYHQCLNYIKHEKIKNKFEEEEKKSSDHVYNFHLHEITSEDSGILRKDLSENINKAIQTLPDQCRRIFLLSRKYGLKNREIAEYLDISLKVVEKQVAKALLSLREHFRELLK